MTTETTITTTTDTYNYTITLETCRQGFMQRVLCAGLSNQQQIDELSNLVQRWEMLWQVHVESDLALGCNAMYTTQKVQAAELEIVRLVTTGPLTTRLTATEVMSEFLAPWKLAIYRNAKRGQETVIKQEDCSVDNNNNLSDSVVASGSSTYRSPNLYELVDLTDNDDTHKDDDSNDKTSVAAETANLVHVNNNNNNNSNKKRKKLPTDDFLKSPHPPENRNGTRASFQNQKNQEQGITTTTTIKASPSTIKKQKRHKSQNTNASNKEESSRQARFEIAKRQIQNLESGEDDIDLLCKSWEDLLQSFTSIDLETGDKPSSGNYIKPGLDSKSAKWIGNRFRMWSLVRDCIQQHWDGEHDDYCQAVNSGNIPWPRSTWVTCKCMEVAVPSKDKVAVEKDGEGLHEEQSCLLIV